MEVVFMNVLITFALTILHACLRFQTTIIAVTFDGGVVLGSDSRVSAG